jgi:maleylpyruvate isomerase
MAIMEWLEEKYPTPSLFTGDSYMRAQIRRLAETVNSGTQPLQNLDVMKRVSSEKTAQDEWVKHWIMRGLGVYESILKELGRAGKKFSVSDTPTIADICLIPQCYSAKRFEVDLAHFPQCHAIYDYAMSTKECMESAPERWKP